MESKEQPNFEGVEMKLPTMRPGSNQTEKDNLVKSGTVITLLFVALGFVLAGLTYWYITAKAVPDIPPLQPTRPTLETNREPETTTATAAVESFGAMSTSDELTTIEADLESTNLDTLESELLQIDQELEASFQ